MDRALFRMTPGFSLWALLLVVGCGHAEYDLAPVRGRVTIDGLPVPAGKVMFAPRATGDTVEAGRPAFGQIQPDGSFRLGTYAENDGAIVGDHWVTIFGPRSDQADLAPQVPGFGRLALRGDPISVVAGKENLVNFDLTGAEVMRFARPYDD